MCQLSRCRFNFYRRCQPAASKTGYHCMQPAPQTVRRIQTISMFGYCQAYEIRLLHGEPGGNKQYCILCRFPLVRAWKRRTWRGCLLLATVHRVNDAPTQSKCHIYLKKKFNVAHTIVLRACWRAKQHTLSRVDPARSAEDHRHALHTCERPGFLCFKVHLSIIMSSTHACLFHRLACRCLRPRPCAERLVVECHECQQCKLATKPIKILPILGNQQDQFLRSSNINCQSVRRCCLTVAYLAGQIRVLCPCF